MRETEVIRRIRALSTRQRRDPRLLQGIGDDCAILRPRAKEDLVFTTDLLLEGRHFERNTHSARDIGRKALARSLSDLAAMGAEPVFCLVSLSIPANLGPRWIDGFYNGLLALAGEYGITLAGGDLARFERIIADVMCCGRVPRGKALLRSAAKPGDQIYVTGELGGSARGLAIRRGAAWQRHRRPEPRVREGVALRELGVRACMDLSDGLSLDLQRLCLESNVSAELRSSDLPLARGATQEQALHGGEDYELLFTARPALTIPARIGSGVPLTCVGFITRGDAGSVRIDGRPLAAHGFDHFA